MLVMKFGGASLKDADAIRNVVTILEKYKERPLIIVASAFGKTTNHLVELAETASGYKRKNAYQKFDAVKKFHLGIIEEIFEKDKNPLHKKTSDEAKKLFTEINEIVEGILLLKDFPAHTYDRIVSYGELLATTILSGFLNHCGLKNIWMDAREFIKTDSAHKDANVLMQATYEAIQKIISPKLKAKEILLTQGYIASDMEEKTTTLGREGSDYTAGILGNILNAKEVILWKDVEGIYNANPNKEKKVVKLNALNYKEAVEMFYYGAKVVHPKTIMPLQNKNIPLRLKPFQNPSHIGTLIYKEKLSNKKIPSLVEKENQCLITIYPKDFAFITGNHLTQIIKHTHQYNLRVNLVQNSAVSLSLCVDFEKESVMDFINALRASYNVVRNENVKLRTLIHFNHKTEKEEITSEKILLIQQNRNTKQVVYGD